MKRSNKRKRFSRIYIEITNICNMSCSFCIGNSRESQCMKLLDFEKVLMEVKPYTDHIYLHVLGEPLMHPELEEILELAYIQGLQVSVTTNGTLLKERGEYLLEAKALRKVSISVHSMEGADKAGNRLYLHEVSEFAREAAKIGIFCELRIWNLGVDEISNVDTCREILDYLEVDIVRQEDIIVHLEEKGSVTLQPRLFLGKGERFQWPSLEAPLNEDQAIYCHGLRSQLAILCDGTVVPCCLDSKGDVNLGNVLEESLGDIIDSQRASAMCDGFSERKPTEELCRRCGYATRF